LAGAAVTCGWFFLLEKSGRKETSVAQDGSCQKNKSQSQSKIIVIAHRDELIELQRALQLKPCE